MLILSRKVGEAIRIDDSVVVTVLGLARGQVKIGIDAPRELAVHREEVYRRIQTETSRDLSAEAATTRPKAHEYPSRRPKADLPSCRLEGNGQERAHGEVKTTQEAAAEAAGANGERATKPRP